jgi:hypothetical protein
MSQQPEPKDALAKAWEDYCNKCFKVGQLNEWIKDLKRQYELAEDAVHQAAIKHDNIKKQYEVKPKVEATPEAKAVQ